MDHGSVRESVKAAVQFLVRAGGEAKIQSHDIEKAGKALVKEGFRKNSVELLRAGALEKLFENQEIYSKDVWLDGKPFTITAHVSLTGEGCWFNKMPIR